MRFRALACVVAVCVWRCPRGHVSWWIDCGVVLSVIRMFFLFLGPRFPGPPFLGPPFPAPSIPRPYRTTPRSFFCLPSPVSFVFIIWGLFVELWLRFKAWPPERALGFSGGQLHEKTPREKKERNWGEREKTGNFWPLPPFRPLFSLPFGPPLFSWLANTLGLPPFGHGDLSETPRRHLVRGKVKVKAKAKVKVQGGMKEGEGSE